MAKNVSLLGANYPGVPAVVLPQTGGGNAVFVDADDIGNVENALAIVVDGDTAPKAISKNQYLFVKNNSTLETGGYHATQAIANGATINSSNTALDESGIANRIANHLYGTETFGETPVNCGTWVNGATLHKRAYYATNVTLTPNTDIAYATITGLAGRTIVDMHVTLSHSSGVVTTNHAVEAWLTDGANGKVLNLRQGFASVGTWTISAVFYYID